MIFHILSVIFLLKKRNKENESLIGENPNGHHKPMVSRERNENEIGSLVKTH